MCFLTTTFSNLSAPCTLIFDQSLTATLQLVVLHFDRIDSGFNDVKDPDELFTFKKMVKHFKKVKVQYKDKETGQRKEVTTEHCLKLGQLFHSIFNCLYVRLQEYARQPKASTFNCHVQICDQSDQGASLLVPQSANGKTV